MHVTDSGCNIANETVSLRPVSCINCPYSCFIIPAAIHAMRTSCGAERSRNTVLDINFASYGTAMKVEGLRRVV